MTSPTSARARPWSNCELTVLRSRVAARAKGLRSQCRCALGRPCSCWPSRPSPLPRPPGSRKTGRAGSTSSTPGSATTARRAAGATRTAPTRRPRRRPTSSDAPWMGVGARGTGTAATRKKRKANRCAAMDIGTRMMNHTRGNARLAPAEKTPARQAATEITARALLRMFTGAHGTRTAAPSARETRIPRCAASR